MAAPEHRTAKTQNGTMKNQFCYSQQLSYSNVGCSTARDSCSFDCVGTSPMGALAGRGLAPLCENPKDHPPAKIDAKSMPEEPPPELRRVPPSPALPMADDGGALARVIAVNHRRPAIPPHAAPPGPLRRPSLPHVAMRPLCGVRGPRASFSNVRFWISCARCPHHPPTTHHPTEKV